MNYHNHFPGSVNLAGNEKPVKPSSIHFIYVNRSKTLFLHTRTLELSLEMIRVSLSFISADK